MEYDLKGNENCFELAEDSSNSGFELPGSRLDFLRAREKCS